MITIILNDLDIEKVTSSYPNRTFNKLQIEQIAYRMYLCQNCVSQGKCLGGCGCNPYQRISEPITCNEDKFPDFFNNENQWYIFKQENNIIII